jgi:hypothetical protein
MLSSKQEEIFSYSPLGFPELALPGTSPAHRTHYTSRRTWICFAIRPLTNYLAGPVFFPCAGSFPYLFSVPAPASLVSESNVSVFRTLRILSIHFMSRSTDPPSFRSDWLHQRRLLNLRVFISIGTSPVIGPSPIFSKESLELSLGFPQS